MTPIFLQFWEAYPARNRRKAGKGETWKKWQTLDPQDYPMILIAARHYAKEVNHQYAKDPVRFLKLDYWRDWLDTTASPCTFRSLVPCEHLAEPEHEVCAFHRLYREKLARIQEAHR